MARHPWVAAAEGGVRFGLLVNGARGRAASGSWQLYADPLLQIAETARRADALGFDALFVPDDPGSFPDPFATLAYLAGVTRAIRLGTLVLAAPLRHPALVARLAADIDRASRGRLVLGFGIGESAEQFAGLGVRWSGVRQRQAALAEALEILAGVWGAEPFTLPGEYFQTRSMHVQPAPVQQPRPPIIIGGAGRRTFAQVAGYADACNFGGSWGARSPEDVHAALDRLRRQCELAGRSYDDILPTHLGLLVLATTPAEVESKLARLLPANRIPYMRELGWLVDGTPEQVISYYQDRISAGMRYFVVHLADTADEETLTLLADEVKPRLVG